MNFRTTYILFGALVILLGLGAWSLLTGPKPGDETLLFPQLREAKLESKDIDSLTVDIKKPKEQKLVFARNEAKKWELREPSHMRVDQFAVDGIVNDVLNARRDKKSEPTTTLDKFGLDQPSIIVKLTKSATDEKPGEKHVSLSLGSTTVGGAKGMVYAASSESPQFAVQIPRSGLHSLLKSDDAQTSTAGDIVKSINDIRAKDLLLDGAGFSAAAATQQVRLTDGKTTMELKKEPSGTWVFAEPKNYGPVELHGEPASSSDNGPPAGVEPLLSALANIKPEKAEDFVDDVKDFNLYGLQPGKIAGPQITIERKTDAGIVKETLLVGSRDDKSGKYYVRLEGDSSIETVPERLIDPIKKLLERPSSLRDKNLLAFSPTGCDALDVQLGSEPTFELRKVGTPPAWRLYDQDGSSKVANSTNINDLLASLGGKVVKDFPEAGKSDADLGFDKPEAVVTLYLGGVIPEEPKPEIKDEKKDDKKDAPKDEKKDAAKDEKKDAPKEEKKEAPKDPPKPKMKDAAAKLIFGKKDKDIWYVRRVAGGTSLDFAVSTALDEKIAKRKRISYLDPTLPSFTRDSAVKLAFIGGAEPFTIEKKGEGSAAAWQYVLPQDKAGKATDFGKVDQILFVLSSLRAEKLWAEKSTPAELQRYGLQPPKLSCTVTSKTDKGTEDRVYLFGGETEDKQSVYAKQGDRDLVYLIPKSIFDLLKSADVADPTIFKFDIAKLKSMKLIGWQEGAGPTITRDLERKSATEWTSKMMDNFKPNSALVETLAAGLSSVRAEKYAVKKTGPKPEHKLLWPAGALQITLTVEGEKEPFVLVVGGPDPEGQLLYATSNRTPGDVFMVPKAWFEAAKAKPGNLAAAP